MGNQINLLKNKSPIFRPTALAGQPLQVFGNPPT